MVPTYALATVKRLIREGQYLITVTASTTAFALGFDDEDIADCIVSHVTESDFHKTMPAAKAPGLMQDVYRARYSGKPIYIKVQVNADGKLVVISFKEDRGKS